MGIFPKLLPSAYSKLNSVSAFGLLPAGSFECPSFYVVPQTCMQFTAKLVGFLSFYLLPFFFPSPRFVSEHSLCRVPEASGAKPWQYDVPSQNDLGESSGKSWLLHLPGLSHPFGNFHRSPPGTSRDPAGL